MYMYMYFPFVIIIVVMVFIFLLISVSRRSPSPSQKTPNRILHIENLTRPFTILQLKELLQEDGVLVKGGFWTNRIKSHCIAIVRG